MSQSNHCYERQILPYVPEFRRSALRLTRCEAKANDLVQEVLMRAWTGWPNFTDGTNARAWVHRILRNTFVNHYRRNKREREVLLQVHREDRRHGLGTLLTRGRGDGYGDEVEVALRRLSPEFRDAIRVVDEEELSYQEAAKRLKCPVGTVMSRLHRGRKQLQKSLRGYALTEGVLRAKAA